MLLGLKEGRSPSASYGNPQYLKFFTVIHQFEGLPGRSYWVLRRRWGCSITENLKTCARQVDRAFARQKSYNNLQNVTEMLQDTFKMGGRGAWGPGPPQPHFEYISYILVN